MRSGGLAPDARSVACVAGQVRVPYREQCAGFCEDVRVTRQRAFLPVEHAAAPGPLRLRARDPFTRLGIVVRREADEFAAPPLDDQFTECRFVVGEEEER